MSQEIIVIGFFYIATEMSLSLQKMDMKSLYILIFVCITVNCHPHKREAQNECMKRLWKPGDLSERSSEISNVRIVLIQYK